MTDDVSTGGKIFLSTLSLRRATVCSSLVCTSSTISIHALLAESDKPTATGNDKDNIFLSTLSLRRATIRHNKLKPRQTNFYPRSPCGERLTNRSRMAFILYFYPRSPCGERHITQRSASSLPSFLSTLSLRRATRCHRGDDRGPVHFYPRSPCGERPMTHMLRCCV